MEFKYTDYCTVFSYVWHGKIKVQFYDEIKDRPIKTVTVESKDEAEELMKKYVANAPEGVICERLD